MRSPRCVEPALETLVEFLEVEPEAGWRHGTSSHELGRALGVTQKTAWFMLHRIRETMKETNAPMLAGEVEADETFVGGTTHREMMTSAMGWKRLEHAPGDRQSHDVRHGAARERQR